jgi:hypothetical protein
MMASEQEMSGVSVTWDEDAESASGSSGNELSERKRKDIIRIGLPSSPFGKIVAVNEDGEKEREGAGATEKQEEWEEDGTDDKGSDEQEAENAWVDGDEKTDGGVVLTKDGEKKTEEDEEKSAAVDGKRKEEEEETEKMSEAMKRDMEEERWAEGRMREIREEEEKAWMVRAAAEERAKMVGWAAFEAKRIGKGGKETIDLREETTTRGKGLVEVKKTGEKKREEETWREKREATARVKALMEQEMRAKAEEKSREAGGEEKKEARMEGGWGEEPKWHVSGMTGGHTKREMWKMMLTPVERGGNNVVARYLNTNRTTFTSKNKIIIIIQRRHL